MSPHIPARATLMWTERSLAAANDGGLIGLDRGAHVVGHEGATKRAPDVQERLRSPSRKRNAWYSKSVGT
jgi:hypothetical protein